MRTVFGDEFKADLADLAEEGLEAVAKRDASNNGTGLSIEKGATQAIHKRRLRRLATIKTPVTPVGKKKGKSRQHDNKRPDLQIHSKDYVPPGK